jgi:hypothetical protein
VTATAGVRLVAVALTAVPVAAVCNTLKNDFAPATTAMFAPPGLVTVTVS